MVKTSKLKNDYQQNHLMKRKMLQDKNQGVFVEDMLEQKRRYREQTMLLPIIGPNTSSSINGKNSLRHSKFYQGGIPKPLTSQIYNQRGQGPQDHFPKSTVAGNNHRQARSTLQSHGEESIHTQALRFSQDLLRKNQNNTINQYDLYYQQKGGFLPNH